MQLSISANQLGQDTETDNPKPVRDFSVDNLTVTISLSDLDNLPQPDELAGDIVENLEAALLSFRSIVRQLA